MIAGLVLAAALAAGPSSAVQLDVPVVRRSPERCGPAALQMVLRYHRAPGMLAEAKSAAAYDPVLRGALITRLAAAAREAGFDADIEAPSSDSLIALLRAGLPPIVLYDAGVGPVMRAHYAVLVGWEPGGDRFLLQDGGPRLRRMDRRELARRRRGADDRVLVVRPGPDADPHARD